MEPFDTPRELTLEEAIALAVLLQKNDQLVEAGELYLRVLGAAPDHPDALHYAGVLAHQQGRRDDAIALIEKSLALSADRADCYNNLGIVLQSRGRWDRAIEAYERAIALDSRHANAYSNLGTLLRATGRPVDAESSYRTAIEIDSGHVDAYTNLGILLNALNRTEEAAACYCKVVTLRPKNRDARRLLALAHCVLGDVDEAVQIFEDWLGEEPDDPIAIHMLAACTGHGIPPRASDGFVQATFDSFAASFESKLARLHYRAPSLIAATLADAGLRASRELDVLDAGCGTGLCAPLVAPYARRLTGVDLSEGMLAHAREKNVYDAIVKAELTEFLGNNAAAFDLIVSADTLVYFGDLKAVVDRAARSLRPNGLFVFTLERAVDQSAGTTFRLELHGRYSHGRDYVERLLSAAGLHADVAEAELRMESGAPVPGLVIRAANRR